MDPFARLVDKAATDAGLNDYQLSAAIGLMQPGNRVFGPKQVGRLRRGEQRHYDRQLVARLIEVLPALDPAEAWHAAGLWPPGLEPEDLPNLSERAATRRTTAASRVASHDEGAAAAASPLTADQRKPTTAYFGVLRDEVAA
jgi:hypothetical protein